MATSKSKSVVEREITILARYVVKQSAGVYIRGSIIFLVTNDAHQQYQVTLRRNGVHSCQCDRNSKGHKRCYHITRCVEAHNKRVATRRLAQEMEAMLQEAESLAS
jgi:hypothetical protein